MLTPQKRRSRLLRIRLTILRVALLILGFVWGINSFFSVIIKEHAATSFEVIIELPAMVAGVFISFIGNLIGLFLGFPKELPQFLEVTLFIVFFLLSAFAGAALGYISAAAIEKWGSDLYKTRLRLALSILGFGWGIASFFIQVALKGHTDSLASLALLPATVMSLIINFGSPGLQWQRAFYVFPSRRLC